MLWLVSGVTVMEMERYVRGARDGSGESGKGIGKQNVTGSLSPAQLTWVVDWTIIASDVQVTVSS